MARRPLARLAVGLLLILVATLVASRPRRLAPAAPEPGPVPPLGRALQADAPAAASTGERLTEEPGPRVRVHLRDAEGRLLEQPTAVLEGSGPPPEVATGVILLEHALEGRGLRVGHAGYRERLWHMPLDCPPEVSLTLERSPRIHGRVVALEHDFAAGEVCVVAWPVASRRRWPTLEEVRNALREPGDVRACRVEAGGSFELADLNEGELYELVAAGGGYLTHDPTSVRLYPDDPALRIALQPVFGLVIEVTDDRGMPPKLCPSLAWAGLKVLVMLEDASIPSSDLRIALNGYVEDATSTERCFLNATFVTRDQSASMGPTVELAVELPGYQPLPMRSVDLGFLGKGSVHESIQVSPTAPGFGELSVLFAPPGTDWLDATSTLEHALVLRLKEIVSEGKGASFGIRIQGIERSDCSFANVPYGRYRCSLQDWGAQPVDLPEQQREICIGPGETVLDLRTIRWGALRLSPLDRHGAPWSGPLGLHVAYLKPDGRPLPRPYFFRGPPYRIPLTRFGSYSVQPVGQEESLADESGRTIFEVVAGQCTEVVLPASELTPWDLPVLPTPR